MMEDWKKIARERATNPEYPNILLHSIENELEKKQPDRAYILSKIRSLNDFVRNDANFERKVHDVL